MDSELLVYIKYRLVSVDTERLGVALAEETGMWGRCAFQLDDGTWVLEGAIAMLEAIPSDVALCVVNADAYEAVDLSRIRTRRLGVENMTPEGDWIVQASLLPENLEALSIPYDAEWDDDCDVPSLQLVESRHMKRPMTAVFGTKRNILWRAQE